jgi:hypothetical protein
MESRAEEALKAIGKGEILSTDEFSKQNRLWIKKKYTKTRIPKHVYQKQAYLKERIFRNRRKSDC